jgi:hypothetical protein
MPFAFVHFAVRLFHAVIFALCFLTWNASEASSVPLSDSVVYGPATPEALKTKAGTDILSFQKWKENRMQQARQKINWIREQLDHAHLSKLERERQKTGRGAHQTTSKETNENAFSDPSHLRSNDRSTDALTEQLKTELESYEFAQKLTLSDYLLSYLAQQRNRKAAIEAAAAQMSPRDVADLIELFAQRTQQPRKSTKVLVGDSLGSLEF